MNYLKSFKKKQQFNKWLAPFVRPKLSFPVPRVDNTTVRTRHGFSGVKYFTILPLLVLSLGFIIAFPLVYKHIEEWPFWCGIGVAVLFYIILWAGNMKFLVRKNVKAVPFRTFGAFMVTLFGPTTLFFVYLNAQQAAVKLNESEVALIYGVCLCLDIILYRAALTAKVHFITPVVITTLILLVTIMIYYAYYAYTGKTFSDFMSLGNELFYKYVTGYLS